MLQHDLQQSMSNINNQMNQLPQTIKPLLVQACATPPAVAVALQPVSFALTPGITNPDQLMDISNWTAQALYNASKAKLMDDESKKYDHMDTLVVDLRKYCNQGVK